jgi:aldose sugar dehydrogenase
VRKAILMTAFVALLAACGDSSGSIGGAPGSTPTPTPTPTPTFSATRIGTGSYSSMAFLPDGRALFVERGGAVRIGSPDSTPAAIGTIPSLVLSAGGILDVAVDPNFATTGLVYFSVTEGTSINDIGIAVVRATVTTNGGVSTLGNIATIWHSDHVKSTPTTIRTGGALAVSSDGLLYLAIGDFGIDQAAQDLNSSFGKVIRITNTGAAAPGNPFAGRTDARAEIWSYGHRDPYGLTVGADGRVYETERGPGLLGDELNVIAAGLNYGWPLVSEGQHDDGTPYPRHSTNSAYTAPVFSWTRVEQVSDVIQVRSSHDGLQNQLLVAGTSEQAIPRFTYDGAKVTALPTLSFGIGPRVLVEAPDGRVYGLTSDINGDVFRIDLK